MTSYTFFFFHRNMDLIIHADEDEVMDLLGGEDVLTSQSEEEDSFNKNIVGCVPESETCECVICRYLPAEARMMRPLSRPGEDAEVSLPPFEPVTLPTGESISIGMFGTRPVHRCVMDSASDF